MIRDHIEDLYADYADALDDGKIEIWPDFFTEECFYQVIPRDNFDRGMQLAVIRCESRGMLQDRVTSVRQTTTYAPRSLRHLISQIRIRPLEDGTFTVKASYVVLQTLVNEMTQILSAGKYLDEVVATDSGLKFRRKICVFDSVIVPNSLIYPI